MSSVEQNKEVIRRLFEEDLNQGDEAVAAEIIHPDFVDHTNPPDMQHGLEGRLAIVRLFRAAFPDLRFEIDDLIAEGDKVVARVTMTGTQSAEFFGIPPTGRSVRCSGVHVYRIADGRNAEHWGANDDISMMKQLGVMA